MFIDDSTWWLKQFKEWLENVELKDGQPVIPLPSHIVARMRDRRSNGDRLRLIEANLRHLPPFLRTLRDADPVQALHDEIDDMAEAAQARLDATFRGAMKRHDLYYEEQRRRLEKVYPYQRQMIRQAVINCGRDMAPELDFFDRYLQGPNLFLELLKHPNETNESQTRSRPLP
jgi:hypothetical protein